MSLGESMDGASPAPPRDDAFAEASASPRPVTRERLAGITRRLAATAEACDRAAEFPSANFDMLAREGLIGLTVAPEFGGGGAGWVETLRVLGAVAKGEPSTALILFMTYGFHAHFLRPRSWPPHLYQRLAREAAAGGGLIGVLRVEPELGTPMRGGLPKTVARRCAEGWALSGSKIYSTGSTGLNWFSVWARTDEAQPRVGNFLVAAGSPGATILPAWDHLGMRATVSHEVVFENTPVPADHAVDVRPPAAWAPKPGDHAQSLWAQSLWNALAISTIYDAVARAARDWLRDYLKARTPTNLGAALATLPRVQEKFGEIEALLQVNRTLIETAAAQADIGAAPGAVEANTIKHVATGNAIRAVEIGLELTGNPGISRHNPLERHYRDVLCSRIHSPQGDTVLVAAGRAGLASEAAVFEPASERRLAEFPLFIHERNLGSIPHVAEVAFLPGVGQKGRTEDGDAFAARAPNAVVGDAVRSVLAQRPRQLLAGRVIVVVVDERVRRLPPTQVVQIAVEVDEIDPHIELHPPLRRCAHEALAVVFRFGDGGIEVVRGIEHPKGANRETAAIRVEVRKGRHDDAGAGAADAIRRGNQADIADLVSKPRIGQGFQLEYRLKVGGSVTRSKS